MNFGAIISALVPYLLQLIADPKFQAIVQAILNDLNQKVAGGVAPDVATQQASGLLGAAAMLHLTGNPVADFQTLMGNLKSSTGTKFP